MQYIITLIIPQCQDVSYILDGSRTQRQMDYSPLACVVLLDTGKEEVNLRKIYQVPGIVKIDLA